MNPQQVALLSSALEEKQDWNSAYIMELAERTGLTFDRVRDWKLQTGSLTP